MHRLPHRVEQVHPWESAYPMCELSDAACEHSRCASAQKSFELPLPQIESVARSNDSHLERAQSELAALRHFFGVVELDRASVDESNATLADYFADFTAHDHRGVFVDAKAHDVGIAGDRYEQPIQSPSLREVCVDERLESKQA